MKITIQTIPQKNQRYDTVGDWEFDSPFSDSIQLQIRVSDLGDWRMETLAAVHELVEALLCRDQGITTAQVDAFDSSWLHGDTANAKTDEPGDHPEAPYRREHCFASAVERMLAAAMGVSWAEYEKRVEEVSSALP